LRETTDGMATFESDGGRTIELRIPAKPEYITLCRLALTGLGQLREIGEDTMADLKLALTEAVSNSVRHAYGPDGDGSVGVRYELHPDRLGIEVVDDGAGFDPNDPSEHGAPSGDDLTEGGLGIAIIKSIADEFDIHSQPGVRGSTLRFVKRLA
jgi:serine/threonine-protein kinase RsbW